MEKRKTKKELAEENQKVIDSYDYLSNAVSTMDCTGLIPSAPKNTAELDLSLIHIWNSIWITYSFPESRVQRLGVQGDDRRKIIEIEWW